ncbi:MAG: hypothetical protein AB7V16_01320 [Vulcanibacillus sp.]
MAKLTCVILGLALLALGIVGVTGFVIDMTYINIGAIVIGALGLLVGIYARQSKPDYRLKTETATQKQEIEQQKKEIDQHKKEIELHKKEIDQQKKEIEQQRKEIEEQKDKNRKLGSSV